MTALLSLQNCSQSASVSLSVSLLQLSFGAHLCNVFDLQKKQNINST